MHYVLINKQVNMLKCDRHVGGWTMEKQPLCSSPVKETDLMYTHTDRWKDRQTDDSDMIPVCSFASGDISFQLGLQSP